MRNAWQVIVTAFSGYARHRCPQMAAAIAFYTIFSLAPTLLIVVAVADKVFRQREEGRTALIAQFEALVGPEGAAQVEAMMSRVSTNWGGLVPTIIGAATVFIGATAVFSQIRLALNVVMDAPTPPKVTLRTFWKVLETRLLSLAMVLAIAFLLLVSLALSAFLAGLSKWANSHLPIPINFLQVTNFVVPLLVITSLFAAMFKVLPGVKITWRDTWVGAFITALLFSLGKFLVGMYMGRSTTASVYGAAGSVIIILLWVYYSALIF
ncbi:MAG: YihY/virulence factor BrkB family protein, partial [Phycisphaerales bacterium]|nr:YihY/virulence factor BrkB family protein [Phycisphaerales bacterium]